MCGLIRKCSISNTDEAFQSIYFNKAFVDKCEMGTKSCAWSVAGHSPDPLSICRADTADSGDDLGEMKEIAAHN